MYVGAIAPSTERIRHCTGNGPYCSRCKTQLPPEKELSHLSCHHPASKIAGNRYLMQ